MSHCGWHAIARKSPAKRLSAQKGKQRRSEPGAGKAVRIRQHCYAASLLGSKKGGACRRAARGDVPPGRTSQTTSDERSKTSVEPAQRSPRAKETMRAMPMTSNRRMFIVRSPVHKCETADQDDGDCDQQYDHGLRVSLWRPIEGSPQVEDPSHQLASPLLGRKLWLCSIIAWQSLAEQKASPHPRIARGLGRVTLKKQCRSTSCEVCAEASTRALCPHKTRMGQRLHSSPSS